MRKPIDKKEKANKDRARIMDYKKTFNTPEGARVFGDLMRNHGMMGSTFNPDPILGAYNEGQRSVVLRIMMMMKMDLTEFDERIDQANEEYAAI